MRRLAVLPFACCALFAQTGCLFFTCPPDSCPQAEEGRTLYAPVLSAIESYRDERGAYPDRLNDLVPQYLAAMPKSANENGPRRPDYARDGDSFRFWFRYYKPGSNICTFTPAAEWQCEGHY